MSISEGQGGDCCLVTCRREPAVALSIENTHAHSKAQKKKNKTAEEWTLQLPALAHKRTQPVTHAHTHKMGSQAPSHRHACADSFVVVSPRAYVMCVYEQNVCVQGVRAELQHQ